MCSGRSPLLLLLERGNNAMSSRIFQSIVLQMKECSDRAVGVIDDQGTVLACNELTCIGEKWSSAAAMLAAEADGSVVIPEALRKYMGIDKIEK